MDRDLLATRLTNLERQNKRQRFAMLAGALLFLSLFLMGQTPSTTAPTADTPRTAVVDGLIVQDSNGQARIALGVNDSDEVYIMVRDKDALPLILLSGSPKGSELALRGGQQANNLIRIASGNDGSSGISIMDPAGKNRVVMLVRQDSVQTQAGILILDPEQQVLFSAPQR
jgi:hypothetical protein